MMNKTGLFRTLAVALVLTATQGCTVNPVTGDREITLVSEEQEIQIGAQNYAPMRQAQGGEYDVDPGLTRYVSGVGQKLAAVSDRELPYEFVVLNNSVPNAWALPGGKIAINRGLLTELGSEAELAAVLGHEIVHAAARHSAQQMTRGVFLQGLLVGTAIASSDSDYQQVLMGGAQVGAQLLNQKYGRDAELESDKYGMRYMSAAGYDPQGAVSLQETFVRLSEGRRQDWLSGLFASHPPSQVRVEENRRIAGNLPPGGEIGADAYQAAMKRTMDLKPAYDAYEEGRKALSEKDTAKALAQAERAIGLFDGEAHFYALRGDAQIVQERWDRARRSFSNAIQRRNDFFYYHLQRGLINTETGRDGQAVTDLEASIALLETAPAHHALGTIAEKRGETDKAMAHYKAASGGSGQVANAAQARLVRLDLSQNPSAYISRRCDAGRNGNLVVSVRNDTSLALRDIQVVISVPDNVGRVRQVSRGIRGALAAGQVASVDTGLGPYVAGSACPVTVSAARIAR